MRGLRLGILLGAAVAALSAATACGGGGSGGGDTSSSSTTGTGGATTSSTTSSTGSTGGTGGTGGTSTSSTTSSTTGTGGMTSSSSTGGGAPGYCTKPCNMAADCCPVGDPSCPGPSYPSNYACTNGACYAPECSSTSDCTALDPKLDCFSFSGFEDCAFACQTDADCTAPLTCTGVDDNNKKFCVAASGGCTDDASCNGLGKCVNKVCVCDADADCTKPGFTKCAK